MAEEAPTMKVAFTNNYTDAETLVFYWRGQKEELSPEAAMRAVGSDNAIVVEEEELKQQKAEDLDQAAEALGVDVSDAKNKSEKAKKIAGEAKS